MKLTELPNIGKTTQAQLHEVGIETAEDLFAVGSREAFLRLRTIDPGCCFSCLQGLEGAVRGVRWHALDDQTKRGLKEFFDGVTLV